jgi:hypothetical protein
VSGKGDKPVAELMAVPRCAVGEDGEQWREDGRPASRHGGAVSERRRHGRGGQVGGGRHGVAQARARVAAEAGAWRDTAR